MTTPFQKAFIDEAQEIFEELEHDFVTLETSTDDNELINKIFRGLHTLKGSGAMFEFHRLSGFAHELETLFDAIRNEKISVTAEIITISLESLDLLKVILNNPDDVTLNEDQERHLVGVIQKCMPENEPDVKKQKENAVPVEEPHGSLTIYRINFRPGKDIFIKGISPIVLLKNLASLGTLYTYEHEDNIPVLGELNPEWCYTSWTCILVTTAPMDSIRDVFIFAEGSGEITISEIISGERQLEEESIPLIGDILLSKGDITNEEIDKIIGNRKLFGQQAVEMGFVSKDKVVSALFEQNTLQNVKKEIISHTAGSSIRVQNEKLDILTNAVSELVTLQARLSQYVEVKRESELTTIAEYLEKLTLSLRDTVMVVRMVPVEEGFSSMHRLVRDLARDLKKKVNLKIIGGDTELDKTVIDNLKDPMMHLVRNCVDHGLEYPDQRVASGKPESGQVSIRAEHIGSHVIITVTDDGKGLDSRKILSKAVEKGIISSTDNLTEEEIFQLIFLPGFSTAEKTTSVSGRGVGMDVVKRNIEAIRGEVTVESQSGLGTTVKMKLPITLAIIDGLLFTVGDEIFVINISSVSECMELTPEIRSAAGEQNILRLREAVVPFVSLRDIFNIQGKPPEHEQIIIVHTHDQTLGFVVDSVEGKHQTVVKTTGRLFSNVKEVIGATILGDGRIALILDVNCIAEKVNTEAQLLARNCDV
ncbi:MAG TPA: chemotaxis protein CheA [Chitinispirillaceae bacterium]|nr:chemotaxis protein CheA [Chitinispirillaceae bacterium]